MLFLSLKLFFKVEVSDSWLVQFRNQSINQSIFIVLKGNILFLNRRDSSLALAAEQTISSLSELKGESRVKLLLDCRSWFTELDQQNMHCRLWQMWHLKQLKSSSENEVIKQRSPTKQTFYLPNIQLFYCSSNVDIYTHKDKLKICSLTSYLH